MTTADLIEFVHGKLGCLHRHASAHDSLMAQRSDAIEATLYAAIIARLEAAEALEAERDALKQALYAMVSERDDFVENTFIAECDRECSCPVHTARAALAAADTRKVKP